MDHGPDHLPQRLLRRGNLIFRVLQLQVEEFHHGPDGHLLGFLPIDAVVADEICAVGEPELVREVEGHHLGVDQVEPVGSDTCDLQ